MSFMARVGDSVLEGGDIALYQVLANKLMNQERCPINTRIMKKFKKLSQS